MGKHISDTKSSYDDTEKRLSLMVGRVKDVIELGEKEEAAKLPAGNPELEAEKV